MAQTPWALTGKTKRHFLEAVWGRLQTDRASFEEHWLDISDHINPRRTRFFTADNQGGKRNQRIINNHGTISSRTLASGLHAGLTSPARPWFTLSTSDPALNKKPGVKAWLHQSTRAMQAQFQQTNLYNSLPIVYGDLGDFGTAAMAVLRDTRDLFRSYTYPVGSYWFTVDVRGLPNVWVHEFRRSVRQVVEQFGSRGPGQPIDWSRISLDVKRKWEEGQYELPVELLWLVMPNPEYDPRRARAKYKRFMSCYLERQTDGDGERQKILRESGFDSFPILIPRWHVTSQSDTYGMNSCGMTALGDIRQLQSQEREKGKAVKKMVDPPLVGPYSLRTQKTSLLPGHITYQDVREGMQGLKAIHEIGLNIEHLALDADRVSARIDRAYFADLFLMLATSDPYRGAQPPTAREIEERHEEKLLALGPVLERTNDELLDPMIDRVYALMEEASRPLWDQGLDGMLPIPPEELNDVALRVEYTSIMAQAQKLVGLSSIDRFVATMASVVSLDPIVGHKIDWAVIVDEYQDGLGINPRAVRSTEEATARLEQQQQAQAAVMAAEAAQKGAAAAKSASEAKIDGEGDTVLNRIAGQASAA